MGVTSIEWTDVVWNCVRGCSRISSGCEHCYAERQAARFSDPGQYAHGFVKRTKSGPRWTGKVALVPSKLEEPRRWRNPRRIFVNSMSDLFHESLAFEDVAAVYGIMAQSLRHTFQVLTKRPARRREFFAWISEQARWKEPERCFAYSVRKGAKDRGVTFNGIGYWPLPNVWEGVSCEDQATATERVPILLDTPAALRFVSAEPLLGPLDLCGPAGSRWMPEIARVTSRHGNGVDLVGSRSSGTATLGTLELDVGDRVSIRHGPAIDWVIVGGESGPGARPAHPAWLRSIVRDCQDAGIACFVKQIGAWSERRPEHYCRLSRNRWSHESLRFAPDGSRYKADEPDGYNAPGMVTMFLHGGEKNGDPAEWPEDLRVREFPKEAGYA